MTGHRLLGLTGTVALTIVGACPEDCLTRLAAHSVGFRQLRRIDDLTIRLTVSDRDVAIVRRCAQKAMCSVEVQEASGLVPAVRAMGLRVFYPLVLLGMLLLVLWLQTHIFFFSVSGNETVPAERILWVLEEYGIKFGVPADAVDLNAVKNQVLAQLPELGWITINTEGASAEVVVRERAEKPAISRAPGPANVTAKKSGLITEVEVTGGTPQVQKGSIVEKGDLLISGITNLDKTLLLTRAEGEVYARTWNRVQALSPENAMEKIYTGRETVGYSITIGKKTLNFYKTSGISYDNYDKIMESSVLTLPGGYAFPVTVTKICFREYTLQPVGWTEEEIQAQLERAALIQIQSELVAGTILDQRFSFLEKDGALELQGIVECQEEIGTTVEIKD